VRREPSRLEQRLTDEHRLVRIAVVVFCGMAAIVLLGLSAREFEDRQCAQQMLERRATAVVTVDGGCELTFADGSVEVLRPADWATWALAGAAALVVASAVYWIVSGRRRTG
jgi:hypothetical protein